MNHRAFVFDEDTYQKTLFGPLLDNELDFDEAQKALGKLYDATSDLGLGASWGRTRAALAELFPEGIAFLTGAEVPGFSGWYTQSAETVARHLPLLEDATHRDTLNRDGILRAAEMARAAQGRGLLVRIG
jgi:hypothetical protein